MTEIFEIWCEAEIAEDGRKTQWRIAEREGGRALIIKELATRLRDHYVSDHEIALFLEELGYEATAAIIREQYPKTKKGMSADLGEILAAELTEEWLGHHVPVKKLRHKEHRDQAMRGEDIVGVDYDDQDRLKLLKGESKSAQSLATATVEDARSALEANYGRPTAHGLIFLGRMLIAGDDEERRSLGADILKEAVVSAVPRQRIAHLLFTLTGNAAGQMLDDDFDEADGRREQHSTHLRILDHADFVKSIFEEALALEDD